jgi:hypothetical protein
MDAASSRATRRALEEVVMPVNEAGWDRAARVVAGVALMGLAVAGPLWPWGLLGAVPLMTGATGWCPLYTLLGVNTCPTRRT